MVKQPRIPGVSPTIAWMHGVLFAFDPSSNIPNHAAVFVNRYPSESACHFVDGFGQPLDVPGGDASDRDTPILCRIDRMLLRKNVHLIWCQARVCEHADL
jgi:hypothetical protein